jgi:hypothetical protein
MKVKYAAVFRLFALAAVLVGLCAAARADDMTGLFGAGANVGASIPLGGSSYTDFNSTSLGIGPWFTFGLIPNWAGRLAYDHLAFSGPSGLQTLNLSASYAINPAYEWNPSFRLGFGPAFVKTASGINSTVFGITAGLAADKFVRPDISIGAALEWFGVFRQGAMPSNLYVLRPGVTIGYWFGRGSASPTP